MQAKRQTGMEIIYVDKYTGDFPPIVATVGFFDGVHQGHRFLIEQLKNAAKKQGLPSAVITFPVHPRKVLDKTFCPELLNSFEEKLIHLANTGIDYCLVLDFSKELSQLSAKEFIQNILHRQLHVNELIVGYDHRFGKDRSEGIKEYTQYGKEINIQVTKAKSLKIGNVFISSTVIRNLLHTGNIKRSSKLLSYNYLLKGTVIAGDHLGRNFGFPTANIHPLTPEKVVPTVGIYVVYVHINNLRFRGMLYIGSRPTIKDTKETRIEVHILDFSGDIYGQTIIVEFISFLRKDKKFNSLEELKTQLEQDQLSTKNARIS